MPRARTTAAVALALAGTLTVSACSGSAGGAEVDLRIGVAYDTDGPGDEAFGDAAVEGARAAAADRGGSTETVTAGTDDPDGARALTRLAAAGFDPVIAVGFEDGQVVAEVAAGHPDTQFAVVDVAVADLGVENLTGLVFAEGEGAFLAGVAAAAKSVTEHVGVIGAGPGPLEAGFVAGAHAVDPGLTVDTHHVRSASADPGAAAHDLYGAGADIVFAALPGAGEAVFAAAVETGQRAIGATSDRYLDAPPAQQAVIMTSMVKRADVAVQDYVAALASGTLEPGTDLLGDLSTGAVGLSDSGGAVDDIGTLLADYRQRIVDGEIDVAAAP